MEKTEIVLVPTLGLIFSDMLALGDEFIVTLKQLSEPYGSIKLKVVKGDDDGIRFITRPPNQSTQPIEETLQIKELQKGRMIKLPVILNSRFAKIISIDRVHKKF